MSDNHAPLHAARWFEIPSPDLAASQRFYESVLACSLRREVMGPSTIAVFPYADGGSSGCLHSGANMLAPGPGGTLVYLDRAVQAGAKIAAPRASLPPGMGFIAHIIDPAGNRVGLHALG